jgi:hypothetical protein
MWRAKTADEKCPEKRIRRRCQLGAAILLLLDVAIPSPSSHGWISAGLAAPIDQLIPEGVPRLTAVGLVLAACYWLFRSPVVQRSALICQKCNRVMEVEDQTQCRCCRDPGFGARPAPSLMTRLSLLGVVRITIPTQVCPVKWADQIPSRSFKLNTDNTPYYPTGIKGIIGE